MFHRRSADQTAEIWARQFGSVAVNKKLSYLYLANEVVQQSRAKKKEEFVVAFGKVLPAAIEQSYSDFSTETRKKVKRVLDVWKQRSIFASSIISDIESRIAIIDKSNDVPGRFFESLEIPSQLSRLSTLQKQVNNLADPASRLYRESQNLYRGLFESETLPTPPVYAARLSALAKKLTFSINTAKSKIQAKKDLCDELRKLLNETEVSIAVDETQLTDLQAKISHTHTTQAEVKEILVEEIKRQEVPENEAPSEIAESDEIPTYDAQSSDEDPERDTKKRRVETSRVPEDPRLSIEKDITHRGTTPQIEVQTGQDEEYDPTVGMTNPSQSQSQPLSDHVKAIEGLDPSVAAFLTSLVQAKDD